MTRIYLIRHGKPQSGWGEAADPDPGLDATGQAQAEAVADWLAALPEAERPTRVMSSPLRRCRETAWPFAATLGMAPTIEPAVGEIPTPEGLATEVRGAWLKTAFEGEWSQIAGDRDYEAWRAGVVAALVGQGGTAVYSHFVAINAVVSILTGDPRVVAFRPDHTSVTVLESDGWALTLVAKGPEAATQVL